MHRATSVLDSWHKVLTQAEGFPAGQRDGGT